MTGTNPIPPPHPPNVPPKDVAGGAVRGQVRDGDGGGGSRVGWLCLVVGLVVAGWALLAIPARATYGARTTADEPQYLLSALSLAEDRDLWIEDEIADARYEPFHEVALPLQTESREDGRAISPHDPLLPLILAVPMGLGGWVAAKATLALLGGVLAALLTWIAHRRFGVSPRVAAGTVLAFALAAPLAPYATQVYPELPAALAVTVVIAAVAGPASDRAAYVAGRPITMVSAVAVAGAAGDRAAGAVRQTVSVDATVAGPAGRRVAGRQWWSLNLFRGDSGRRPTSIASNPDGRPPSPPDSLPRRPAVRAGSRSESLSRPWLVAAGLAIVSLPWLGVKYAPVAGVLALVCMAALWQAGRVRAAVGLAVALGLAAVVYLVGHRLLYGGWTVYAAGDHFVSGGELSVVGSDPNHVGRSRRLVGLLLDRSFGLAAWMPGYLLAVPALAALLRRRPAGSTVVLVAPLLAGWATATWVALTMHGWWWPGRQTVVVLPCLILAVAWWVDQSRGTVEAPIEPAPVPRPISRASGAGLEAIEPAPGGRRRWRLPGAGSSTRPGVLLLAVAGVVGAVGWVWVVVEAWRERLTLIVDFDTTSNPLYRGWRLLLPEYRHPDLGDWLLQAGWLVVLGVVAVLAWRSVGSRRVAVESPAGGAGLPESGSELASAPSPDRHEPSGPAATAPSAVTPHGSTSRRRRQRAADVPVPRNL
jgi:hypothetical protein